ADGQVGEFTVRSPSLTTGYWRQPEKTAQVLRDGWYATGDAGYRGADGLLYIVDRVKDMIVTGGENVYSAEVEQVLIKHPAVSQCAVIGLPDEKWGEAVTAVVVSVDGEPTSAEALIAHCREFIAGYKAPKSVHFVDALPLTGSGKVQKALLRDNWVQSNG
ncbi:MAG: AMP-binding protein, partial [Salinisphaera sp.]|nr:AMP-binding protein [Salinisphaera sp.]